MLDDILHSIRSQVSERLSSPLIGAFAISWCLWNYRFLVILFSNNTVTETFKLIDSIAFPPTWSVFLNGVLYPLLSALSYIFLYPYPARVVYRFVRERQRDIAKIRQQIEDETPLTQAEAKLLKAKVDEIKLDLIRKDDSLELEREKSKKIIDQLQIQISALQKESNEKTSSTRWAELGQAEVDVIRFLIQREESNPRQPVNEAEILNSAELNHYKKTQILFALEELKRNALLESSYNTHGQRYTVSYIGRDYALNKMPKSAQD